MVWADEPDLYAGAPEHMSIQLPPVAEYTPRLADWAYHLLNVVGPACVVEVTVVLDGGWKGAMDVAMGQYFTQELRREMSSIVRRIREGRARGWGMVERRARVKA
jgi:hypothetical protein